MNDAIGFRDLTELIYGDNEFPEMIELDNTVRTKRNELNLSIWAYRCHIGDKDEQTIANNFNSTIQNSKYQDIMNGQPITVHHLIKSIHYGVATEVSKDL